MNEKMIRTPPQERQQAADPAVCARECVVNTSYGRTSTYETHQPSETHQPPAETPLNIFLGRTCLAVHDAVLAERGTLNNGVLAGAVLHDVLRERGLDGELFRSRGDGTRATPARSRLPLGLAGYSDGSITENRSPSLLHFPTPLRKRIFR